MGKIIKKMLKLFGKGQLIAIILKKVLKECKKRIKNINSVIFYRNFIHINEQVNRLQMGPQPLSDDEYSLRY